MSLFTYQLILTISQVFSTFQELIFPYFQELSTRQDVDLYWQFFKNSPHVKTLFVNSSTCQYVDIYWKVCQGPLFKAGTYRDIFFSRTLHTTRLGQKMDFFRNSPHIMAWTYIDIFSGILHMSRSGLVLTIFQEVVGSYWHFFPRVFHAIAFKDIFSGILHMPRHVVILKSFSKTTSESILWHFFKNSTHDKTWTYIHHFFSHVRT